MGIERVSNGVSNNASDHISDNISNNISDNTANNISNSAADLGGPLKTQFVGLGSAVSRSPLPTVERQKPPVAPGTATVCPSVFVIPRFAWGVRVSVSVAELLAGFGSGTGAATVAVLLRLPVADALIVPVRV